MFSSLPLRQNEVRIGRGLIIMNETQVASGGAGGLLIPLIICVLICAFLLWKVFTKAGRPGWASIIPIYNGIVLLQIAGKPGWWVILFVVPIANIVIPLLMCLALAERFGKGAGFGVGLFLLGIIFFPILGFGSAEYQAGAAPAAPEPPPASA